MPVCTETPQYPNSAYFSCVSRQYVSSSSAGDHIPDYDMPMPGTMQSGQSYSSSTLNTHYNYQVTSLIFNSITFFNH